MKIVGFQESVGMDRLIAEQHQLIRQIQTELTSQASSIELLLADRQEQDLRIQRLETEVRQLKSAVKTDVRSE